MTTSPVNLRRLNEVAEESGLKQAVLADIFDCSQATVSRRLGGIGIKHLPLTAMMNLCRKVRLPLDTFLEGQEGIWKSFRETETEREKEVFQSVAYGTNLLTFSREAESYITPEPLALWVRERNLKPEGVQGGEFITLMNVLKNNLGLRLKSRQEHKHTMQIIGSPAPLSRYLRANPESFESVRQAIMADYSDRTTINFIVPKRLKNIYETIRKAVGAPYVTKINVRDSQLFAYWIGSTIVYTVDQEKVRQLRGIIENETARAMAVNDYFFRHDLYHLGEMKKNRLRVCQFLEDSLPKKSKRWVCSIGKTPTPKG